MNITTGLVFIIGRMIGEDVAGEGKTIDTDIFTSVWYGLILENHRRFK